MNQADIELHAGMYIGTDAQNPGPFGLYPWNFNRHETKPVNNPSWLHAEGIWSGYGIAGFNNQLLTLGYGEVQSCHLIEIAAHIDPSQAFFIHSSFAVDLDPVSSLSDILNGHRLHLHQQAIYTSIVVVRGIVYSRDVLRNQEFETIVTSSRTDQPLLVKILPAVTMKELIQQRSFVPEKQCAIGL